MTITKLLHSRNGGNYLKNYELLLIELQNWRSFKQHAAAFFAKSGEKGLTFGILTPHQFL